VRSWLVAAGLWAIIAVHALANPRPPDHTWGIVGMLILRPVTRWVLLTLVALLVAPPVARWMVRRTRNGLPRIAASLAGVPAWLWIALLVAVAWLLRSRALYGDAELLADCLTQGQWTYYKEPLGFFAIAVLYRTAHALADADAATSIAIASTLAGAVYWAAVARLARSRPLGPGYGWVVWLLLGTTGSVATYFGLIEKRGLLVAGALWTLVLLLEAALDRRRSLQAAAAVLGLTLATHLAAVWLAPAALAAWFVRHREALSPPNRWRHAREAWQEALRCAWLSLLPLAVAAAVMAIGGMPLSGFSLQTMGGGDSGMFVPLFRVDNEFERFTMFSRAHLEAVGNELLLLAPVGLVLAALLPLARPRIGPRRDGGSWVLAAAGLGFGLFVFLYNPDMMVADPRLGVLNDWDLFSVAGPPFTLLGLWALRTATEPGEERDALCLSACAVSLLHVLPWLLLNAGIRV
jgi:hypothetical protein